VDLELLPQQFDDQTIGSPFQTGEGRGVVAPRAVSRQRTSTWRPSNDRKYVT
jgi:hypothetical protein